MVGAVSSGLGGTGRAAVESNESLYLNPASIALLDGFYTGFFLQQGFVDRDISRRSYGLTLSDGTEDLVFPGSLGFRRNTINQGATQFKENEFKAGFSHRLTQRVSLGLGASYLRARDPNGAVYSQNNLDLGVLLGLMPNWGLSISGENLLKAESRIPVALVRNSYFAVGTQYVFTGFFSFRYEALWPLYLQQKQYLAHRAGVSITMVGDFHLNTGYSIDDSRRQNWTSVGVVWRGPRLKFAYSYQTEGRQGLGERHLIDMWFDF